MMSCDALCCALLLLLLCSNMVEPGQAATPAVTANAAPFGLAYTHLAQDQGGGHRECVEMSYIQLLCRVFQSMLRWLKLPDDFACVRFVLCCCRGGCLLRVPSGTVGLGLPGSHTPNQR